MRAHFSAIIVELLARSVECQQNERRTVSVAEVIRLDEGEHLTLTILGHRVPAIVSYPPSIYTV